MAWNDDSARHALASMGIKTTFKSDKKPPADKGGGLKVINLGFESMGLKDANLHEKSYELMKNLCERDPDSEWIADLDYYDNGNIVMNDHQATIRPDESQLFWNDYSPKDDPHNDPEFCIGFIHYHPPKVDERPSAQDFVLALTIDELRSKDNKKRYPETMFGVVIPGHVRLYSIKPDEGEHKVLKKRFEEIQCAELSNDDYFNEVEELIEELTADDKIHVSGWFPLA